MDEALTRYRDRALAILDASPPTSADETRTLLVDPLLSVLGWDVSAPTCDPDVSVADATVEYVLSVPASTTAGASTTSTPGAFVAVEPADAALRRARVDRLRTAMAETGVDRAIYTTGRRINLLAGPEGEDRVAFDLQDVDVHAASLAHFEADTVERRLDPAGREAAARRLSVRRDAVSARLADDLAALAGEPHRPQFERAAREFLSRLAPALRSGDGPLPERDAAAPDASTGDGADQSDPAVTSSDTPADGTLSTTARGDTSGPDAADSDHPRDDADRSTPPPAPPDEPDGEFVVRFFADRGSVGAVGHSTPSEALAAAAEYLFERGLSGVRTPWIPGDGADPAETVLNDAPTLADGTPMAAARELSNGTYVNTGGDVATKARRVEALTERAGLRAMLGGDWAGED